MVTPEELEILQKHLAIVRAKKSELFAEFAERLEKITARERMIVEDMGEEYIPPPRTEEYFASVLALEKATMAEAAELALRKIGVPARMPQIVALLQSYGFHPDDERNKLGNTIFKSMARSDIFVKNDDLTWGLAEWQYTPKKGE